MAGHHPPLPLDLSIVRGAWSWTVRPRGESLAAESASSKKPTTRRSYSSGRASMPPVCPAPGTSQISLGSRAAS